MSLRIHTLKALKDNFVYVLEKNQSCAVIDPGEAAPVEAFLKSQSLKLDYILCTHHHADHIAGAADLTSHWGCEVWCSEYDRPRISAANVTARGQMQILGEAVEILSMPGHTIGQIAYYFPRIHAVFVGDTLFSAGCGRLFEGSAEQMFTTLQTLTQLPAETKIYFGHEYTLRNLEFVSHHHAAPESEVVSYRRRCEERLRLETMTTPTDIGTELKINPFLRARNLEEFTHWRELRNHF
jgi:hydroxyacylglutathione hydrolase